MNRTKIEYVDYTWNPCTGCTRRCDYCYAMRIAETRLRGRYGYPQDDPFKVTFHPNRLNQPLKVKKPSKIFTCSMGDFFDPNVLPRWRESVFDVIRKASWHTFILPTKTAHNLRGFSFPENLWLGVSVDSWYQVFRIRQLLRSDATIKFVSFEPLLESIETNLNGIDWVIIGAQTGPKKFIPLKEWVETLTTIAKYNGCAVFHKDNLGYGWLKEYPE